MSKVTTPPSLIADNVLRATANGALTTNALLDGVGLRLSADKSLRLIVDLRIAPLLAGAGISGLSESGMDLLAFIRMSLVTRNRDAKSLARALSGHLLSPRKFAFALNSNSDWLALRYFRDLDFFTPRDKAKTAIQRLAVLGFFVGDIDPSDWRYFIVPPPEVLERELKTIHEMHLVSVTPTSNTLLSDLFRRVSDRYPTLNECQYYGFIGEQFSTRSFVDIQFEPHESVREERSVLSSYVAQLAEDAVVDIVSGRLGVNQAIEMRSLDSALQLGKEMRPRALQQLIATFGEPWRADSDARPCIVRFVAEKLDRLTSDM